MGACGALAQRNAPRCLMLVLVNGSTITQYVCWKRGKFFAVVDARGTSQECPECKGEVKKDLSIRIHDCPHCGYKTDRDVASGQVIRNRGIELISTAGLAGKETACAADLPGVGESQPRQVAKPLLWNNQEISIVRLGSPHHNL